MKDRSVKYIPKYGMHGGSDLQANTTESYFHSSAFNIFSYIIMNTNYHKLKTDSRSQRRQQRQQFYVTVPYILAYKLPHISLLHAILPTVYEPELTRCHMAVSAL